MKPAMVSYSEAGRMLGVDRRAVAAIALKLGIDPQGHPSNRLAKGLTVDQVCSIERMLDHGRNLIRSA